MENIIKRYFNLRADQASAAEIADDIRQGCEFKGTNLWALVAAILIASVGLNNNSAAVIIGAMLISPLMGPIVGTGYALATFDFDLLKTAGRNFLTFVVISLITSAIFFGLSPFDNPTPEMDARTYPTIYDVLIAFFGGVAGIVAYTRKEKGGNIIPGVAIATALMPPLCTAGFGLTHPKQFEYFLGPMYLFVINSVMIAFATLAVSKLVLRSRRRKREDEDEQTRRRVTWIVSLVMAGTVLPSLYLAYTLVQKNDFDTRAQDFLQKEVEMQNIPILKTKVSFADNYIEVFTLGDPDSLTKALILYRRTYYGLSKTPVEFKSAREYLVTKERANRTAAEQQALAWRDSTIALRTALEQITARKAREARILTELMAVDTNITAFGVVPMHRKTLDDSLTTILITCRLTPPEDHLGQVQRLLETKYPGKKVEIYYEAEVEPSQKRK